MILEMPQKLLKTPSSGIQGTIFFLSKSIKDPDDKNVNMYFNATKPWIKMILSK